MGVMPKKLSRVAVKRVKRPEPGNVAPAVVGDGGVMSVDAKRKERERARAKAARAARRANRLR